MATRRIDVAKKLINLQQIELQTYHDRAKVLIEEALEATVRLENCCERMQIRKKRQQVSSVRLTLMQAKNQILLGSNI